MHLILVRHCEAAPGEPDELRPLTDAGRAAARALAERLQALAPAAVFCSPLLRARETAETIARACGLDAHVDERLAPGASVAGLRELATAGTVVAVGHQPDCSEIYAELTGEERGFAPGDAAEIEL